MEVLQNLIDLVLHLDRHLNDLAGTLGPWLYLVLFLVVFCETGLVVTPILPGDSLLFAVGALAASDGSPLLIPVLLVLLILAAVAGDSVNYFLGQRFGARVFCSDESRFFNRKHLIRTQEFYAKYGGKTIILARFIPIIRTFAPFVAGMGQMNYRKFWLYNVAGGIAWVLIFLLGGYFLADSEVVKGRFHIVILAIVLLSIMPAVIEFLLAWRRRRLAQQPVSIE
jgi:membrane-associated protein